MNLLKELSMSQGHLNYSEKIHETEGFGTSLDWLMWYSPYSGVKLKDPRIEKMKGEMEGLRLYNNIVKESMLASDVKEKHKANISVLGKVGILIKNKFII